MNGDAIPYVAAVKHEAHEPSLLVNSVIPIQQSDSNRYSRIPDEQRLCDNIDTSHLCTASRQLGSAKSEDSLRQPSSKASYNECRICKSCKCCGERSPTQRKCESGGCSAPDVGKFSFAATNLDRERGGSCKRSRTVRLQTPLLAFSITETSRIGEGVALITETVMTCYSTGKSRGCVEVNPELVSHLPLMLYFGSPPSSAGACCTTKDPTI